MSDFVFATAQYESGDWDSAPMVPANIIDTIARYTSIDVAPSGVIVPLSSPTLFRGGLLFVDDHNHDIDGVFHKTAVEELTRIYGALHDLPKTHPLYRAFFTFDDGPPTTSHELNGWGDNLVHKALQGVERAGRLVLLYSSKDYSSEWNYHPDNKRFLSVDNTKFAANLVVYALTR